MNKKIIFSAVAGIVSTLMPWMSNFSQSTLGINTEYGKVILFLFLIAILIAFLVSKNILKKNIELIQIIPSLAVFYFSFKFVSNINILNSFSQDDENINIGFGIYLTVISAIALMFFSYFITKKEIK